MASWKILLTLDQKSDDFARFARGLLSDQRHEGSDFPRFAEEDALRLIELIEPTVRPILYSLIGVVWVM